MALQRETQGLVAWVRMKICYQVILDKEDVSGEWHQDLNTGKFSEDGQEGGKTGCYRSLETEMMRYSWRILSKPNQLRLYMISTLHKD